MLAFLYYITLTINFKIDTIASHMYFDSKNQVICKLDKSLFN